VATLVQRNVNEAIVASMVGSDGFRVWQESVVWSQAVGFVLVRLASVAVNIFSHLICSVRTFYTFCTFNEICNDNAATNCFAVQHEKVNSSKI
jgi:hypothetical protein